MSGNARGGLEFTSPVWTLGAFPGLVVLAPVAFFVIVVIAREAFGRLGPLDSCRVAVVIAHVHVVVVVSVFVIPALVVPAAGPIPRRRKSPCRHHHQQRSKYDTHDTP